ncbi:lysine 5,6-aminomutase reactivase ATPase KamC [Fusibacter ferrireducens]|uniref:DNA mismatch repair protein MutS n=1 Tax=Fusibacter ferrireducens TaxID=2785058 RepID=A0ABR9ZYG2_9FIRM|nr:DNA mismatch repair protein MutS [Fusibacter ferrireducens]MBF4695502.1 DNA mismatch repair protein MutS [Fusibacter ferrireducens]
MFLSEKQYKDLDLDFIFERIKVETPYGELEKRGALPFKRSELSSLEQVFDVLEKVMVLLEDKRYEILELKSIFKNIKQLSSTYERIEMEEVLSVTELFEIKVMAMLMKQISGVLDRMGWVKRGLRDALEPVDEVIHILDPERTGTQSFYIYDKYSETLRGIRKAIKAQELRVHEQTEIIKQTLDAKALKIKNNGDIQIQKSAREQLAFAASYEKIEYQSEMPTTVIYRIKQDPAIKETLERLTIKEEEEEYLIRTELSSALKAHLECLVENANRIGRLDYLLARATFSKAFDCTRPKLNCEGKVSIKSGRHLKVANRLALEKKRYTPIDVKINEKVTLITGANMGGKTVSLKMIGLLVAMAHYGIFLPCESAEISLFDFVFISVGDSQSIDMGLSTFGGEIREIAKVLKRTDQHGFILIDELARGTNPLEGYAISKALIEHLAESGLITVITTHYDGLTNLKNVDHYQVKGLSEVDFSHLAGEKSMKLLHELMDYRLVRVNQLKEIPKDAIRISEFMGLEHKIIEKAKVILGGSNGE